MITAVEHRLLFNSILHSVIIFWIFSGLGENFGVGPISASDGTLVFTYMHVQHHRCGSKYCYDLMLGRCQGICTFSIQVRHLHLQWSLHIYPRPVQHTKEEKPKAKCNQPQIIRSKTGKSRSTWTWGNQDWKGQSTALGKTSFVSDYSFIWSINYTRKKTRTSLPI